MFEFKVELKEQLLDGRKIVYLANKIGLTRDRLMKILNGQQTTRKLTAYCIVKACNPDAEINDYFIRKEK
jgi:hypothetical protein